MTNKLRSSGVFFACIFLIGFVVNFFFLALGDGVFKAFFHPYQLSLVASVALFLVSAFILELRWIQPAVFLFSCPVAIIDDAQSIYGFGFFIIGILLLERTGFFLKRRSIKVIAATMYLLAIEVASVLLTERPMVDAISPTFFIIAFGFFLWFLYKDTLVIILREPKPKLSLSEKGISPAERTFILETLKGKSQKEIAIDYELSESTIRNTLARSYKKLGVEDKVGLALLGERNEIVD
ncbi:MAG: hypothetical protein A2Z99_14955 [Treponema sp. GWB1_62_6]|nr:MAG: hypothetical protein A2001_09355 [Treponema sp. GWC1_61_84]OHE72365.1 MAG: hypothetical protein A2Z99_14955 [Treponema sp. GWB1_62_6]OHE75294.1 MAG: hypothetical protein A2413_06275 [Treponema sp. RIFOXYC1_FULL_61_9]